MKTANLFLSLALIPVAGFATLPGCSSSPTTDTEKADLALQGKTDVKVIENDSPGAKAAIDQAYGYAIFPDIGKGSVGIAGGGGYGSVYEHGQYYGTAQLTMGDVGLTVGGETYTELVLFQDKTAFDNFTNAGLKLDAKASAVAIHANAAVTPNYTNGIAVYTYNTKGLMLDASVGGQQFTVKPAKTMTTTAPSM